MKPILVYSLIIVSLTSCTKYAYYQSPLHGNSHAYKAIPLRQEGVAVATYAGGAFTAGGANDQLNDGLWSFQGSLHRSHNFSYFQAYYGLTGSLGSYHVSPIAQGPGVSSYTNHNLNDSLITLWSGNKFFGSWGAQAGINAVIPFNNGGEWRAVGVEVSWNNEFGQYVRFRQKLPDTAANIIDRHRQFLTFAISSDLLFPIHNGSIGFKLSFAGSPRVLKGFDSHRQPTEYSSAFLSQTFHLTRNRVTGFLQWNIGSRAMGIQLGANVRLSKPGRK